jgi:hypothetical protein
MAAAEKNDRSFSAFPPPKTLARACADAAPHKIASLRKRQFKP